jgi:hypothetical protein
MVKVSSNQDARLKRVRSELQSAYNILQQIESSGNLKKGSKLDLWRAKCMLELAILLIKLTSGIDREERRARYTIDGEPEKIIGEVKEFISDVLKNDSTKSILEALEKVRKARDLLHLLEEKIERL